MDDPLDGMFQLLIFGGAHLYDGLVEFRAFHGEFTVSIRHDTQRLCKIRICICLFQGFFQFCYTVHANCRVDLLNAIYMIIERGRLHAQTSCQLTHGKIPVSLLFHQFYGCLHDHFRIQSSSSHDGLLFPDKIDMPRAVFSIAAKN